MGHRPEILSLRVGLEAPVRDFSRERVAIPRCLIPCPFAVSDKLRSPPVRRSALLEAVHLTKRYSSLPAMQDLNFTLRPGQVPGCSRTERFRQEHHGENVDRFAEPTQGAVLFNGRKIRDDLPAYRKLLGYVPEEALLYPYLSGWEYLELIAACAVCAPAKWKQIDPLLELFSLHSHRHAAIGSYSKGMRQRILLIAALMDNPEIFIFDEPWN